MVLISVQSVETGNGYQFANDFAESVIINPKSKVSLINFQFERKSDFVVLAGGNQFEVRVGDRLNDKDIIGIPAGNYTSATLAFAIQEALNSNYGAGHNFECYYNQKQNTFNLLDRYKAPSLPVSDVVNYAFATPQVSGDNVVGFVKTTGIEFGANTNTNPAKTGVVNNTSQWVISNELLETKKAPSLLNGGSVYETTLICSNVTTPPIPTGAIASYGVVIGLTNKRSGQAEPASATAPISTSSFSWLECGMVFSTIQSEAQSVKFIEGGVDIGVIPSYVMLNGDTYRIILATDGTDNDERGYPIYQYRRVNSTWKNFNIVGGNQRLSWRAWNTLDLAPVVGTDFSEGGANAKPAFKQQMAVRGGSPADPVTITAGNTNLRLLNHKLDLNGDNPNDFIRSVATANDYATVEQGYITQNVPAGDYSEISFTIDPATATQDNGDFYVSVLDSNQRTLNQLELGATENLMGCSDPPYGNFVDIDNTTKLGVATQNPAMIVYRFVAWNGITDTGENVALNKVYVRHDMNQYNVKGTSKVKVRWDLLGDVETTGKNYTIKVYGSSNKAELWYDTTLVAGNALPLIDNTGAKSLLVGGVTNGDAFTPNGNGLWFSLGENGAVVVADTDAGGNINSDPVVAISGYGFESGGATYPLVEFNPATGVNVGTGSATTEIQATTNTPAMGYGTSFDPDKSYQGYSYWFGFGNKDAHTTTNGLSIVKNLTMKVEDDKPQQLYLEFHPRYEPSFGDTIGFAKQEYLLTNNNDIITSDSNPQPTAGATADHHPTLIVNIDNLPIKSYIGKRMKADATIHDLPVGNQQGLTKMIGKVPRHHDDNGDGGKTNTGPFYYDYFPYSVPLNNATEIVLNELELSVRNPDGTLATDVIEANMLLNISNVESVGESSFGGGIGNPIEAPKNYDRLNVPKGQLQPEIRGGFAEPMGSMNEQPARHTRADKDNDLKPMAHL